MTDAESTDDLRGEPSLSGQSRSGKTKIVLLVAVVALVTIAVIAWVIIKSKSQPANVTAAKPQTPTVTTTTVISQTVNKDLRLPGELRAYQNVAIYPRVQGFVESINVDRGSIVKRGQLLEIGRASCRERV